MSRKKRNRDRESTIVIALVLVAWVLLIYFNIHV